MNDTVKIMKNASCVTWQTALYLEIVCAQGFERLWIWMSSSHIPVAKPYINRFSIRQCKGGVTFRAALRRSRNSGVHMPEHQRCRGRGIRTHLFTCTLSDYHVNGALCNRWMCQTRDGAFTFERWMDWGGRKYGGGLSGLRKLVLFVFTK